LQPLHPQLSWYNEQSIITLYTPADIGDSSAAFLGSSIYPPGNRTLRLGAALALLYKVM